MTESEEIEDIKRSLDIIRKRAGSLKDDLLNFLLDMTILHLSRKIASAADKPTTLTMLHRNLNGITLLTLDFPSSAIKVTIVCRMTGIRMPKNA